MAAQIGPGEPAPSRLEHTRSCRDSEASGDKGPFGALPKWLAVAAIALAAVAPQLATWNHEFVDSDDYTCIVNMPLVRQLSWQKLPDFFRPTPFSGLREYMPLKTLSYAVDYALFGMSPQAFRPQQWLWYAACSILLWIWLRLFLLRLAAADVLGVRAQAVEPLAWLGALMFAVHPSHVESVTWLSGRKDLICACFMFAALVCALAWPGGLRRRIGALFGALFCTGLALLGKPMAAVLPGLLLVQDAMLREPRSWGKLLRERSVLYLGSTALVVVFAIVYLQVTGGASTAVREEAAWRLYQGPDWLRWGQQLGAFAWLSVAPHNMVPLYPPWLLDASLLSWRGIGGLCVLTVGFVGTAVGLIRRHFLAFCCAIFVVQLSPIIVFPPWGQYLAGRYLCTAVVGVILALLWSLFWLWERRARLRPLLAAALVTLVASWALSSVSYARLWSDSHTLWHASAETYPDFTELARRAGVAALRQGLAEQGTAWLRRCIEQEPDNALCLSELGRHFAVQQPQRAEVLFRRALPHDASGAAHRDLAFMLAKAGRVHEGVALYRGWMKTHRVGPQHVRPMVALALLASDSMLALAAARKLVQVTAIENPTGAPPVELLRRVSSALRDTALGSRVERASQQCQRSDCFRREMGW